MLRKLRRQFVFINMLLVSLVLLCVFAALCVNQYTRLDADMHRSLEETLEWVTKDKRFTPQGADGADGAGRNAADGVPQMPQMFAACTLQLDETGQIIDSSVVLAEQAQITKEMLAQAVAQMQQQVPSPGKKTQGVANGLYYMQQTMPHGATVVFARVDAVREAMWEYLLAALAIGAVALLAFFGISLFLARWALRPVEKAWAQQQQFVADASHELKTPLTIILANNSILQQHPQSTIATEQKWIDSTQEEATHMRRLVEQLLFLAQSEDQVPMQVWEPVDVTALVMRNVLQFETLAFERAIEVHTEVQPDITVKGDAVALKQLLGILLDNACKYAGAGGRIDVTLRRVQNKAVLTVSNTGEPIDQADLPHVFERFYRADKARTDRQGSHGLGLAIAKRVAQRHRGKISVQSDAQTGTAFTVTLPAL